MRNQIMISWCFFCLFFVGFGKKTDDVNFKQKPMSEFEQRWSDIDSGDVIAWSVHITGQNTEDMNEWDKFKSVAAIHANSEKACGDTRLDDELWAVVERTIDSKKYKTIEQFQAMDWGDDLNYCWFVDCAPISDVNLSTDDVVMDEVLGDYPTLRPTDDQADPGLTHTTAISDLTGLENIANDLTGKYYLAEDIDASGTADPGYNGGAGWATLGTFKGTLDGCGYKVSDLYQNKSSGSLGLFGVLSGDVANLTLENVDITGTGSATAAGGLCSMMIAGAAGEQQVINCHVSGTITVNGANIMKVGGLVGWIQNPISSTWQGIYDCSSSAIINATTSYSHYTVATHHLVGGLIGATAQKTKVWNCYATGNVTTSIGGSYPANSSTGGLIGKFYPGDMDYCYATGTVTSNGPAGGLCGSTSGSGSFYAGQINTSYATGDVSGSNAGGFAAALGTFADNCYAWGDATGTGYAGGFAYYISLTPENCYSIGAVTGPGGVGGFSQLGGSTAISCYWDTETSGTESSAGGEGKTTTEMKRETTYVDWDFDMIWYQEYTAEYTIEGQDIGNPYRGHEVCVYADGIPLGVYSLSANDANDIVGINEDDYDVIIAGLNYYSIYESFPLVPNGYYSSIKDVKIDFHESMGCKVGVGLDDSVDWIFSYDDFATAIEPVTEIKYAPFIWGRSREPVICLWEWDPVPMTIRGIYPKVNGSN